MLPDRDPAALSDQALSLLPSELATQLLLTRYVWAGTSAVFIWDILSNLKGDYMLLFKLKRRLGWPTAAYFLSRITSAAAVLGCMVFLTYPVGDCRTFHLGIALLFPLAIPSTSLLFFFRVRAVYCCSRTVTIVFGLMWLTVLGTSLLIPIVTRGVNIGPTRYCSLGDLAPYVETIGLNPGLFDTAVFLAISYRLVGNTHVEYRSWRQKARAFFTGAYLPSFSKSLFIDGQLYYMITVVTNITAFILLCFPVLGPAYRSFLVVPNVMLTNIMACRVYRHTRLDLAQQSFLLPTTYRGDLAQNIEVDLGAQTRSLHFTCPKHETEVITDCEAGETEDTMKDTGES
ncbi:hypothetical protein C8F04DRAFT_976246 [Mycena alexandri]|uniref:Uncharacterized protein n=1 Tax=Mycena alexandri TaxID=1745969 RepID=A0AAD6S1Z8_9AGAR|nr:hypothetical protein C8F04DRAFT_976246 [Mycena alexandri]